MGMAQMLSCPTCTMSVSSEATSCPQCGQPLEPPKPTKQSKNNQTAGGVGGLLAMALLAWFYFGGGLEQVVDHDMQKIEQQVAQDAIEQYEIAKRSGKPIDAYVHASLVAAAFLQAKDEANYQKWKSIEEREAARAGMPGR